MVLRFCGGAKGLLTREFFIKGDEELKGSTIYQAFCGSATAAIIGPPLQVNNVDCKGAEEFFIKGDEELEDPWFIEHSFCGSKYCGFWGSTTATAATKRLSKILRSINVEVLLWRIYSKGNKELRGAAVH